MTVCVLLCFRARVSKNQFKLVISVIWVVSGLMGAPYLFVMGLITMENAGDNYFYCYHVNLSEVKFSHSSTKMNK